MKILRLHHSRQGSALLIGMIISFLLLVMTVSFTEKVLSFARSSQGIEQSTKAYYKATSIIERTLMSTTNLKKQPWTIGDNYSEPGSKNNNVIREGSPSLGSGVTLTIHTGSTIIPEPGLGNSQWDSNYNIISLTSPVQLAIPEGITWDNVSIDFRVPKLAGQYDKSSIDDLMCSGSPKSSSGVILWTFGSQTTVLYASGETNTFTVSDLNSSSDIRITDKRGFFYDNNGERQEGGMNGLPSFDCGTDFKCTLKLSMIRPVNVITGTNENTCRVLPFLEYKLIFNKTIPNQYMALEAKGYSMGYVRERKVYIRQITTNTALDFTVLQ